MAGGALVFLTVKELPLALLLAPIGFDTLATEIWDAASSGFTPGRGAGRDPLDRLGGERRAHPACRGTPPMSAWRDAIRSGTGVELPVESGVAVRLSGLRRAYGPVVAVDAVDLEVRTGEMMTVLGPSGCGKTTVLRLIAGLEAPDGGSVEIGGRRVAGGGVSVPPERRRVGMVFQDFVLFPHLSVRDNIAYGLRGDPDRAVRVAELLELIDLADAGSRMPHHLSGGMQQRVALARALAPRPNVVLLDQPFSNSTPRCGRSSGPTFAKIRRAAGTASIFVTHDQDEALTLGDRMAVRWSAGGSSNAHRPRSSTASRRHRSWRPSSVSPTSCTQRFTRASR